MKQPQPSKFPYATEALVSVSAVEAECDPTTGEFNAILCVYIIFKLIAEQTYGQCRSFGTAASLRAGPKPIRAPRLPIGVPRNVLR